MIIEIRGTSGSGKTTVVKRLMDQVGEWQGVYTSPRKKPLYYYSVGHSPRVVVLGHYEGACGGCDSVGSAAAVYNLIQEIREGNGDVPIVCEGLLLSENVKWTVQLPGVRCLFLTTPVGTCLSQVGGRRRAAGNDEPLNPANTVNRVKVIERARLRLIEAGVYCRRASANQATGVVLKWLREVKWCQ